MRKYITTNFHKVFSYSVKSIGENIRIQKKILFFIFWLVLGNILHELNLAEVLP